MIQLVAVSKKSKDILYSLYQLYYYDFSQYTYQDVNDYGLYDINIDHYWEDPRWNPYFIYHEEKIAGFMVVLFDNYDVDPDPTHVIYDFLILKKYRRNGLGREAALQAFNLYKANWLVAQMCSNEPATHFWRKVIKQYTNNTYTELHRQESNKYVQTFSNKSFS